MTIQTLTAEQIQLLKSIGIFIEEDYEYYHLPQVFRRINETDFEVLYKNELRPRIIRIIHEAIQEQENIPQ